MPETSSRLLLQEIHNLVPIAIAMNDVERWMVSDCTRHWLVVWLSKVPHEGLLFLRTGIDHVSLIRERNDFPHGDEVRQLVFRRIRKRVKSDALNNAANRGLNVCNLDTCLQEIGQGRISHPQCGILILEGRQRFVPDLVPGRKVFRMFGSLRLIIGQSGVWKIDVVADALLPRRCDNCGCRHLDSQSWVFEMCVSSNPFEIRLFKTSQVS